MTDDFTKTTTNYPITQDTPIKRVKVNRAPRTSDYRNFVIGDEWLDTSTYNWWKLCRIFTSSALWRMIASGSNVNVLGMNVDASTAPGTNPVVADPSGYITVTGGQVAAGTTGNVIRTDSLAVNTYTVQIQRSQAVASSTIGDNGVSHFDSAFFTVDANGFVSFIGTAFHYTAISFANSPYTVTATDEYISCDTAGGAITILLPNSPTTYRQFNIKDRTGHASANNITLTTVGGVVTIDGMTSRTLAGNYSAVNLIFNGTSYEVY